MNDAKWSARAIDSDLPRESAWSIHASGSWLGLGLLQAHRRFDPGVFVPGLPVALDRSSRTASLGRRWAGGPPVEAACEDADVHRIRFHAGPS
jgi:hypothetical protein